MATPSNPVFRLSSVACSLLTFGLVAARAETPSAAATFHREIEPILKNNCYECHGDGSNKGKVAFDRFTSDKDIFANPTLWLTALKNVRAGLMPPPEEERLSAADVKKLENWIKFEAFGIDPANQDPGRVTIRRLNRAEYHNTIRDLMGVDYATDVEFPPDDTGHGFDNLGEVLTVSPLLLEKYLQAAEEIVDKAVPRVARVPAKRVITPRDFKVEAIAVDVADADVANAAEMARRGGTAINVRRGGKASYTFNITQTGTYKLTFESLVSSTFDFDTGRASVGVFVDGIEKLRQEVVWGSKPIRFAAEQNWAAGPHEIRLEVQPLEPTGPNPADPAPRGGGAGAGAPGLAGGRGARGAPPAGAAQPAPDAATPAAAPQIAAVPQIPAVDGAAVAAVTPPNPANPAGAPAAGAGRRGGAGRGAGAGAAPRVNRSVDVRVSVTELVGPMETEHWVAPENYRRFFAGDPPSDPKELDTFAEKTIRDFATKAFRRPVDDAKVNQLVSVAKAVYTQPGKRVEDGVARAFMGVLASPRFLFRIEEPAATEAKKPFAAVDDYALASRLSYFLWSSMPDAELFRLAERGQLRENLPAQVARMLKDTKSQAFMKNFPGQWLQARDIESVPINARAVLGQGNTRGNQASPVDMNSALRKNMRSETEMYFEYVIREDRSVLEFINSDYTFLNAALATHYGLPDGLVTGTNLRRVTLPPDSPRGGMLTQGTVLAVTSNPTRTSPVKRGLFVLENILGTPPPPPPPDVPALEETQKTADGRDMTLREALAAHRSNALCASCHARMDPLGFALENFNAMGNWRELDAKLPIDPSGVLATGEPFKDIRELKHVLVTERHLDYYRCLTEKMMIYALGRSLDYHDLHTVDEIVARLEATGGKFSTLLDGVINSTAFQKQRTSISSPAVLSDAGAARPSTVSQVTVN